MTRAGGPQLATRSFQFRPCQLAMAAFGVKLSLSVFMATQPTTLSVNATGSIAPIKRAKSFSILGNLASLWKCPGSTSGRISFF